MAGGVYLAFRWIAPSLRAAPPWTPAPADPAAARRFEARLGEAEVEARAGGGAYRIEAPVGEVNAYLRWSAPPTAPVQVRIEEGGRLAMRLTWEARGGPYAAVLRGRLRREAGGWRVDGASGSIGRVGLWGPIAERLILREAPRVLEPFFPGRLERFEVSGDSLALEGRLE